jgi:hypothetical protein
MVLKHFVNVNARIPTPERSRETMDGPVGTAPFWFLLRVVFCVAEAEWRDIFSRSGCHRNQISAGGQRLNQISGGGLGEDCRPTLPAADTKLREAGAAAKVTAAYLSHKHDNAD